MEAGAQTTRDTFVQALIGGRSEDACWSDLAENVRMWIQTLPARRAPHPVSQLAARIRAEPREVRSALRERGWKTFAVVSRTRPGLLDMGADFNGALPVFELAASLHPPGALGRAAVEVVQLEGYATKRTNLDWWRALVRGLREWKRWTGTQSVDDRQDLAFAALCRHIRGMEQFDRERGVFSQALKNENLTARDWSGVTMSKPVSFFYRRDQSPAETYDFTVTLSTPKEAYRLFVHANERLPDHLVTDVPLKGIDQLNSAVLDLQKALRAKGGLIVALSESRKGNRTVRVSSVKGEGGELSASSFLVVEPVRPPRLVAIEESRQTIPAGCHLVCPVDGRAEEQLRAFTENLSWFPEDFELVVLYALVRPSLEERVSELEKASGKLPLEVTRRTAGGKKGLWGFTDRWSWKSFLRGPLFAAGLGLLVGLSIIPLSNSLIDYMQEMREKARVRDSGRDSARDSASGSDWHSGSRNAGDH